MAEGRAVTKFRRRRLMAKAATAAAKANLEAALHDVPPPPHLHLIGAWQSCRISPRTKISKEVGPA